jgi:Na+/melibiose symporter-like transporter
MASDHYRSRFGRRIPFLLWATPCTVISLILVGYAPEIGGWVNSGIVAKLWPVSRTAVVLAGLCVFVVLYHFFNMVLVNMFNCLLRDVVPGEVMVHFLMWFRVVGGLGGFAFSWYIFKYVLVDRQVVCVGVGLLYLGAFLLMCWRVKEGEYPAPPPHAVGRSVFGHFGTYFKECLSIPLYRNFFLSNALLTTSYACAGPFAILFARDTLGISMEDIGKIYTYGGLAGLTLLLPFGYFCRRFNAMRVTLASLFGFVIASLFALCLVKDRTGWLLYTLLITPPTVGWSLAFTTVTMSLFPSEKFGQFSSNLNVLGCGSLIFGNYLMGQIIDWSGSNYRICFLWSAFFFTMAAILMLRVYRDWKRHGGPDQYIPPLPDGMVMPRRTEQPIQAASVCCMPISVRDGASKQP